MKPWEQTWIWDDDSREILRLKTNGAPDVCDPVVETDSGVYGPRVGERELIAAAPEMARLIFDVIGDGHDYCPWCGGVNNKHHDGCEAVRVLAKAGVT